jgi:glutathione S-transferase
MGGQFTVADGYLFAILNWSRALKVDISPWPSIGEHLGRIAARPAVQEALRAEGLL